MKLYVIANVIKQDFYDGYCSLQGVLLSNVKISKSKNNVILSSLSLIVCDL